MKKRVIEKNISPKNYLICAIIFAMVISLSLIFFFISEKNKEYERKIPVLRGVVSEIEPKELDEFLNENSDILLYVGVADDENSRIVEKDFKEIIDNYKFDVVYLNLTNYSVEERKNSLNDISKKYLLNSSLNNYPAFLIINDRKVIDYVQKENNFFSIDDIVRLLDVHEIKGEENA